ncbi:hypothetical protein EXE43_19620 [Halorubrum sp. SS5]|jgi:hypothetical protein|uniref:hypothetical protein n=1 Tax=unclassified Halorubrum TaxID=2642239 RepID=UPI0010F67CFF|nr:MULTISPECIES: hypothetical protein [unclassified Halorubrum]TKX55571.1 hypothetical protein EXE42_03650 [Halorubrum sp. SP3]TKX55659.1 hypothetical protein EXE44_16145 [Halorubrum sp. SS7]TKX84307.1 hypothetical protein EXE43_19620 [Halorubrum sp. SS5]
MSTENQNSKDRQKTAELRGLAKYDLTDCPDSLVSDLYQHIIELQDDLESVSREYNTYLDSDVRPLVEPLAHLAVNAQGEVQQREALDVHEIMDKARHQE